MFNRSLNIFLKLIVKSNRTFLFLNINQVKILESGEKKKPFNEKVIYIVIHAFFNSTLVLLDFFMD